MSGFALAQLNIATAVAPLDGPELAEFFALLPVINALGDGAPGFVWRLQDESGDATSIRSFGDATIVNLTVWESVEVLRDFTYRSGHVDVLRRRREWFVPPQGPHLVLWWIPLGQTPSLDEAKERLELLAAQGAGPDAFTLREPFPPPEAPGLSSRSVLSPRELHARG